MVLKLKVASFLLFWFGIIGLLTSIISYTFEYQRYGTLADIPISLIFLDWKLVLVDFVVPTFMLVYVLAGYWLSKGKKKGIVFGLGIGIADILIFVILDNSALFKPSNIPLRILFAIIIYLIISGRKDLSQLQSANWRPWKNQKTVK